MTTHKEALNLAISRLEWFIDAYPHDITTSKEDFLRPFKEALAQPEQPKVRTGDCLLVGVCASEGHKIQKAQPEQEPVAIVEADWNDDEGLILVKGLAGKLPNGTNLYIDPPQRKPLTLDRYDAGLLNDFGGGNVEWWQDYIRAELDRAHDFYQTQAAHGIKE